MGCALGLGIGLPFNPLIAAAPTPQYVLDYLTVPAIGAYGLRQLRGAYAGACINVRRLSDNAEMDIGFVSGSLDTTTLLTFTGLSGGLITTWYDQSGNGNDLSQSTAANQPIVVSAGSLVTQGGVPSAQYTGVQYLGGPTTMIGNQAAYSANLVWNCTSLGPSSLDTVLAQSDGNNFANRFEYRRNGSQYMLYGPGSGNTPVENVNSVNDFRITTLTYVDTGNYNDWRNGTNLISAASTNAFTVSTSYPFNVGSRNNGGIPMTGYFSELTLFQSELGTSDRQTLEHNQEAYFSITGV